MPHPRAQELYEALLLDGLAVRPSPGAIRVTVHRPEADDRLVAALSRAVSAGQHVAEHVAPGAGVSVADSDTRNAGRDVLGRAYDVRVASVC